MSVGVKCVVCASIYSRFRILIEYSEFDLEGGGVISMREYSFVQGADRWRVEFTKYDRKRERIQPSRFIELDQATVQSFLEQMSRVRVPVWPSFPLELVRK